MKFVLYTFMIISMFNQVSVPQSELLSLIAAAKSLGVRGLAEEGVNLNARLVEIIAVEQ